MGFDRIARFLAERRDAHGSVLTALVLWGKDLTSDGSVSDVRRYRFKPGEWCPRSFRPLARKKIFSPWLTYLPHAGLPKRTSSRASSRHAAFRDIARPSGALPRESRCAPPDGCLGSNRDAPPWRSNTSNWPVAWKVETARTGKLQTDPPCLEAISDRRQRLIAPERHLLGRLAFNLLRPVFRRLKVALLPVGLFAVGGCAGIASDGREAIFGPRRNRPTSQSNMALPQSRFLKRHICSCVRFNRTD